MMVAGLQVHYLLNKTRNLTRRYSGCYQSVGGTYTPGEGGSMRTVISELDALTPQGGGGGGGGVSKRTVISELEVLTPPGGGSIQTTSNSDGNHTNAADFVIMTRIACHGHGPGHGHGHDYVAFMLDDMYVHTRVTVTVTVTVTVCSCRRFFPAMICITMYVHTRATVIVTVTVTVTVTIGIDDLNGILVRFDCYPIVQNRQLYCD
jgi:hypothetical protein